MYTVTKYKNTRHWAVMAGDYLITVCLYKKGAHNVALILNEQAAAQLTPLTR